MEPVLSSKQWLMTQGVPPMYASPLPQLQIQKFSGDIAEFPVFVRRFKNFAQVLCPDGERRFAYLEMYLTGEAAKVIKGYETYENASLAYAKAWEALNHRYNNVVRLMQKVKDEILKGPMTKDLGYKVLNELVIKMNLYKCLFENKGILSELNSSEILQRILSCVPNELQKQFAQLSFEEQKCQAANYVDLLHVVDRGARYAQTEWAQRVHSHERPSIDKKLMTKKEM